MGRLYYQLPPETVTLYRDAAVTDVRLRVSRSRFAYYVLESDSVPYIITVAGPELDSWLKSNGREVEDAFQVGDVLPLVTARRVARMVDGQRIISTKCTLANRGD